MSGEEKPRRQRRTRRLGAPRTRRTDGWRLDFALYGYEHGAEVARLAVECDGHDWHERTPEQAARDKSRDRALQSDGWAVYRFTGSEIFHDPESCAFELMRAVFPGYRHTEGAA